MKIDLDFIFVLKNVFYPKFVPKNVNRFKVSGYKVETIGAGTIPGKQLQMIRLRDGKHYSVSYSELKNNSLTEKNYIAILDHWGFELIDRDKKELTFQKRSSISPKS